MSAGDQGQRAVNILGDVLIALGGISLIVGVIALIAAVVQR